MNFEGRMRQCWYFMEHDLRPVQEAVRQYVSTERERKKVIGQFSNKNVCVSIFFDRE